MPLSPELRFPVDSTIPSKFAAQRAPGAKLLLAHGCTARQANYMSGAPSRYRASHNRLTAQMRPARTAAGLESDALRMS